MVGTRSKKRGNSGFRRVACPGVNGSCDGLLRLQLVRSLGGGAVCSGGEALLLSGFSEGSMLTVSVAPQRLPWTLANTGTAVSVKEPASHPLSPTWVHCRPVGLRACRLALRRF